MVVHPLQHIGDGSEEVVWLVLIAVELVDGKMLGTLGDVVPAVEIAFPQLGGHSLDLQIAFLALVLLQGGNELFHLAHSLLVVDGQEHPGLDIHQVGGHGDKLAGYVQVQRLAPVHPV